VQRFLRQFWESEAIYFGIALVLAGLSIYLERLEAIRRDGFSAIPLVRRVQVRILAIGMSGFAMAAVIEWRK
jgi:hypothetical protein